jgi:hypothetical protein
LACLRPWNRLRLVEKLWHAGEIHVAAAQDHHDAIALRHRNATEEQGGERGGASRLDYLLAAFGEEAKAAKDLFVREGDAGI